MPGLRRLAAKGVSIVSVVTASIPSCNRETVSEMLDDEDLDDVLTDETGHGDYTAIVSFLVRIHAVEPEVRTIHRRPRSFLDVQVRYAETQRNR